MKPNSLVSRHDACACPASDAPAPGSCTPRNPSSHGGCRATEWPLLNDFTAHTRDLLAPIRTMIVRCWQPITARAPHGSRELRRGWPWSCVRLFPACGDPVAGHLMSAVSGNLKGRLFSGARFKE